MDIGFIILCPDRNVGGLKNSVGDIGYHSYDRECLAVVPGETTPKEIKELNKYCEIFKGKDTITSLINKGMKSIKQEWGFIIFSGSRIPPYLERKIEIFAKETTDILYPIVDPIVKRKYNFISGSFNGVLINKKFFNKVGDFAESSLKKQGVNEFEMTKFLWHEAALQHGAKFKGIVGMRII